MRAALYARISTTEGRQHLENQLGQLREYSNRMGWEIVGEFTDQESGAAATRPNLDRMMKAAARRLFDLVLVFDLSRLTRQGPAQAFGYISRLSASKVQFWSMTEEHFRTSGPAGELLLAVAAFIAKQERETLVARIKAGISRAKANGKTVGRKRRTLDRETLIRMRKQGKTIRQLARAFNVGRTTIERRLKAG